MLAAADFRHKIKRVRFSESCIVGCGGAHDNINLAVFKRDHTGGCFRDHPECKLFRVRNIVKCAIIETNKSNMIAGYDFIIHPRAGTDFNGFGGIHGLKSFLGEYCKRVRRESIVKVNISLYELKFKVQIIDLCEGLDLLGIGNGDRILASSLHEREFNVVSVKDRTVMEFDAFLKFKSPVRRVNHFPAFKEFAFILHRIQIGVGEKVACAVLNNLVCFSGC